MIRILFMGTPSFAAVQLRALYASRAALGAELIGVVTQPDRPRGRGQHMVPCETKVCAADLGLPLYQPQTLRDEAFAALLADLSPDLIVVAAYGKILPPSVLACPRLGCINVHGSLLPRWRGAAPIQRALMAGDRETGVTIQYMAEGLDCGDILAARSLTIGEGECFGSLYDRIAQAGAELLCTVIPSLADGTATAYPQGEDGCCYAKKIEKEECALDFSGDAAVLCRKVCALSPVPMAYATLTGQKGERRIKIAAAVAEAGNASASPGTVLEADPASGRLTVACGTGVLRIVRLLPPGKGEMEAAAFLRGRQVFAGDRFDTGEETERS